MKTIAFYLPQFHPIPENDRWWGKGFTEWTNVTRATPLFKGHRQPRLPADLGFYDLRLAEVREAQAQLARDYGIHGFCYHYYWFNGKKLLDLPVREMLKSGQPDFPFCLCFANENWTRRWDGQEHDVLIKQEHSRENDRRFIHEVLAIMQDERYIRINGRPLLLVYRAQLFPDIQATTALWREQAVAAGFDDLYLCKCLTFGDETPPREQGFDAAVEFPPHYLPSKRLEHYEHEIRQRLPSFAGWVIDYRDAAIHMMTRSWPDYRLFKTVMLGWDNSARAPERASIFHHFSLDYYERWLARIGKGTLARYPVDERLVFINAWNEWAEGTYLEPDQEHGHGYLQATSRAIRSVESLEAMFQGWDGTPAKAQATGSASDLFRYLDHQDNIETLLVRNIEQKDQEIGRLRRRLQEVEGRVKEVEGRVEEQNRIISAVYATRGWWVLSKLSRFKQRLGQ